MKTFGLVLGLGIITLTSGCVTSHPTPEDIVTDCGTPDQCWARVLKENVNAKGQVNFGAVSANRAALQRYVHFLAADSPFNKPEKYENADARMAYYLNSYNALAMWGVIVNGIPKDFDGFFKRLSFFKLNEFEIGGKHVSLFDYENNVIRKVGDPRVHFALNCMSVGCPRLPQEPYPVQGLDKVMTAGAIEFFNSPTYLRIDRSNKTASVSEILKFFTGDFVGEGKSPSLIAFINKYSTEKIPEDFEVDFIPYNWTINRQ